MVVQQRLRQHLLQLAVFKLQLLLPPGLVHLHLTELLPPPVVRRLRDVPLLAHLTDRLQAVRIPQGLDLFLRRVSLSLPRPGPFLVAQTLAPSRLVWPSHVTEATRCRKI